MPRRVPPRLVGQRRVMLIRASVNRRSHRLSPCVSPCVRWGRLGEGRRGNLLPGGGFAVPFGVGSNLIRPWDLTRIHHYKQPPQQKQQRQPPGDHRLITSFGTCFTSPSLYLSLSLSLSLSRSGARVRWFGPSLTSSLLWLIINARRVASGTSEGCHFVVALQGLER